MSNFDFAVIGGGPGGYHLAKLMAEQGKNVALFEMRALGGTCLNEGCIPTKALLNCAKRFHHAGESAKFGVTVEGVKYSHETAVAYKDSVVKTLVGGVGASMKHAKVKVINAHVKLAGKTAEGFSIVADNGDSYTAKEVCLASGSETVIPPIPGLKEGLESGFVVTNREFLDMKELPETFAVIGGGVIGLEMACFLASVGVKVTVIEMMNKIAGPTDAEICDLLMNTYKKQGMTFELSAKVTKVNADSVEFENAAGHQVLPCGRVLISAGRRAATKDMGLETVGVNTERGAIVTDDKMATNIAGLYAIGDCNGKLLLAHTAYREAEVLANVLAGKKDTMKYDTIPSVIYTNPEVATVGLSLAAAKEQGLDAAEVKLPMIFAGRFVAESDDGQGFVKIVYDKKRDCLLGAHAVGLYASEMILSLEMMIVSSQPISQLKKLVFPHPTVGEVFKEALFSI